MIDLKSMALEMPEVAGHPNRVGFRGVLTTVDVPSQRAPSGAKGHLVVLTKRAAEAALPSLLGMALDYSPTLDRHDVRRKVGVITGADIVGNNLELEGYLYARDFPEIVKEIGKSGPKLDPISVECSAEPERAGRRKLRASRWEAGYRLGESLRSVAAEIVSLTGKMAPHWKREWYRPTIRAEAGVPMPGAGGLGLSYEVTDVLLRDAAEQVWRLEKVTFTGAAILRRDKAAYRNTWIELSK
ncbi:MAG TPA: hypothetical protein VGG14_06540 [Candidatus Sulfotelmatobacter sp.]|jgi:hypothetical protein